MRPTHHQRHRELHELLPNLRVNGGCCGIDHGHVARICEHCGPAAATERGGMMGRTTNQRARKHYRATADRWVTARPDSDRRIAP